MLSEGWQVKEQALGIGNGAFGSKSWCNGLGATKCHQLIWQAGRCVERHFKRRGGTALHGTAFLASEFVPWHRTDAFFKVSRPCKRAFLEWILRTARFKGNLRILRLFRSIVHEYLAKEMKRQFSGQKPLWRDNEVGWAVEANAQCRVSMIHHQGSFGSFLSRRWMVLLQAMGESFKTDPHRESKLEAGADCSRQSFDPIQSHSLKPAVFSRHPCCAWMRNFIICMSSTRPVKDALCFWREVPVFCCIYLEASGRPDCRRIKSRVKAVPQKWIFTDFQPSFCGWLFPFESMRQTSSPEFGEKYCQAQKLRLGMSLSLCSFGDKLWQAPLSVVVWSVWSSGDFWSLVTWLCFTRTRPRSSVGRTYSTQRRWRVEPEASWLWYGSRQLCVPFCFQVPTIHAGPRGQKQGGLAMQWIRWFEAFLAWYGDVWCFESDSTIPVDLPNAPCTQSWNPDILSASYPLNEQAKHSRVTSHLHRTSPYHWQMCSRAFTGRCVPESLPLKAMDTIQVSKSSTIQLLFPLCWSLFRVRKSISQISRSSLWSHQVTTEIDKKGWKCWVVLGTVASFRWQVNGA